MTSKHRARQCRAYSAGARDALSALKDELKWLRPNPSVMSSMDMLIKMIQAKFPMPSPVDEDKERIRSYYGKESK